MSGSPTTDADLGDDAEVDPDSDEARLARWEVKTRPAIIAAALLPLFGALRADRSDAMVAVFAFGCWAVFFVDLLVHLRLHKGYLRTGAGTFDLFLVVVTFPWYIISGNADSAALQLLRLARLARVLRVVTTSPLLQRFLQRLGRPVGYASIMLLTCSLIVTRAEGPENGFDNLGVGLWWGVVTLTTVGYGDLTPKTTVGRFTAAILMVSGVALLGTVAASLASLFRMEDKSEEPASEEVVEEVEDELAGLRRDVAELGEQLRAVRALLERQADPGSG